MNDSNTMLVVSDRFANLCSIDGVIAYSTLIGHLLRKDRDLTQKRFVITQGLQPSQIKAQQDARHGTEISCPFHVPADRSLVHKAQQHNVLITTPTHANDGMYKAKLLFDERCAEMSDHVTGTHVPGILLFEAGRQMMIAGATLHWSSDIQEGSHFFTFDEAKIRYYQFSMPFEVDIHLELNGTNADPRGIVVADMVVRFWQLGSRVCEMECRGRAYPTSWFSRVETRKATSVAKETMLAHTHAGARERYGNADSFGIFAMASSQESAK